jgi:hypothetical protein
MAALAATAETGLETLGADDFALPFLKLAQGLTPEVSDKNNDVSAGDIFDSVSLEGADAILVIPCSVRKSIIEWAPRAQGGGFRGEHANWADAKRAQADDSELRETYNYTVLYSLDGGETYNPARLSMKSTQIKVAKRWNTNLQTLRVPFNGARICPPMFGTVWNMTSVTQKNQHGTFFNFDVSFNSIVEDAEVFGQAQRLNEISADVHATGPEPVEAEVVSEDSGADF